MPAHAPRPRERLLALGSSSASPAAADALSDAELLAVVLGTGAPGQDAHAVAAALLARFDHDLRRVAVAGVAELAATPGVGTAKALRIQAALALATRLGARPYERGEPFGGPAEVAARFAPRLALLEREVLVAVALDSRHRVIVERRLAEGGVCSVTIHPRDLFAHVLREAAAAVILIHNHPSGDPTPSAADRALTTRLRSAGDLLGVDVLDHVIVAQHGAWSFQAGGPVRVPRAAPPALPPISGLPPRAV